MLRRNGRKKRRFLLNFADFVGFFVEIVDYRRFFWYCWYLVQKLSISVV